MYDMSGQGDHTSLISGGSPLISCNAPQLILVLQDEGLSRQQQQIGEIHFSTFQCNFNANLMDCTKCNMNIS